MKKKIHLPLKEIEFGTSHVPTARRIRQAVKAGELRKIAPKLYTRVKDEPAEKIIRRNLFDILGHYFPEAVVGFRSAFDLGPTPTGKIFLTYKYNRTVQLPGITVHLKKGPGPEESDMQFINGLFVASDARRFLENLTPSRGPTKKTIPQEKLEERLEKICDIQGEDHLNKLRDEAAVLSKKFGWRREYKRLDQLIGAILKSRDASTLKSPWAKTRAMGYDAARIALFEKFCKFLDSELLPVRKVKSRSQEALRNLAFFESYFSNYIEGTTFELDEAKDVVFQKKVSESRPKDAHDILTTFQLVSSPMEMQIVAENGDQFIEIIQRRHAVMMQRRPEAMPGQFKDKVNRAGNTRFVVPELVRGTLLRGFEYYTAVPKGLPRAAFMMFLVAEVHPFKDGNGRLARIMMNAELDKAGVQRIIIPTVYREDYLSALRVLTRREKPSPYVRMLSTAQEFVDKVDFDDLDGATAQLTRMNAFLEPNEGKLNLGF